MENLDGILKTIALVISILVSPFVVMPFIGFLFKARKWKETDVNSKYGIVICARNEEKAIALLIDSIRKQNYPQDKLTIFVILGNSSDNTKQVAVDSGAIVYEEPFVPLKKRNKGRGMKYLFECIERDYGIQTFDGFFTLDADVVLDKNYITEMNKAFQNKDYDFYTSYSCAKNFDETFVSSYAGMAAYNATMNHYRPCSVLGFSTRIRGSTNLYRSHLVKDGWKWAYNSEESGFSATQLAAGVRGSYVEAAKVYEEHPSTLKELIRQRMRWGRGGFMIFLRKDLSLLEGVILNRGIKRRYSAYDMMINLFPTGVLTLIIGFLFPLGIAIYNLFLPGSEYSWISMLTWVGIYYGVIYVQSFVTSLFVIIRENKNIRCPLWKLLLRLPLWPLLGIFFTYVNIIAILKPARWKSLKRTDSRSVETIQAQKTIFQN